VHRLFATQEKVRAHGVFDAEAFFWIVVKKKLVELVDSFAHPHLNVHRPDLGPVSHT